MRAQTDAATEEIAESPEMLRPESELKGECSYSVGVARVARALCNVPPATLADDRGTGAPAFGA